MGSIAGPRGLQAEHEWSRDWAAFAASLVPPGVLLTRSSLKHFRLYFAKLFPFFFFLQVTAKWKSLSLPKLQALSPLFKNTTIFFFSVCNFLLHNCRKRLLQCSAKGFVPRERVCPSSSLPLVPGDAPLAATPGPSRRCVRSIAPVPFPLRSLDAPADNSSCSGASM